MLVYQRVTLNDVEKNMTKKTAITSDPWRSLRFTFILTKLRFAGREKNDILRDGLLILGLPH